jgi:hypothetical protein
LLAPGSLVHQCRLGEHNSRSRNDALLFLQIAK